MAKNSSIIDKLSFVRFFNAYVIESEPHMVYSRPIKTIQVFICILIPEE